MFMLSTEFQKMARLTHIDYMTERGHGEISDDEEWEEDYSDYADSVSRSTNDNKDPSANDKGVGKKYVFAQDSNTSSSSFDTDSGSEKSYAEVEKSDGQSKIASDVLVKPNIEPKVPISDLNFKLPEGNDCLLYTSPSPRDS